ncbi:unnamed protein product [Spodoptera exigua]|nr:unnamed protein product [Spodoptera exigua]
MSWRKVSFRTKNGLECVDKQSAIVSFGPSACCVQNDACEGRYSEPRETATISDHVEISSTNETMSQVAKYPDMEFVNDSSDSATTIEPQLNIVLDPAHAQTEDTE